MMVRNVLRSAAALAAMALLFSSCGIRRHKYDNPISKDTQQPDKVLFDTAIQDIEHGRYERGRLTLQTLMNTYESSEYMAKAKLAIADSWYREGGSHGFAQAEAEYKDFILFYPQMEEAAEAQEKVCMMQYKQMDKADRDPAHALKAEDECRQLVTQFPNSKFAPEAQQYLRNVQEVLAEGEYKVGTFYGKKGNPWAASNRLQALTDQYPLYSKADDALWDLAGSYHRMGDRFENQQAAAYTKIVREYPLSVHADEAKSRLQSMNRPVPEADPVAYARMKYELENREGEGILGKTLGMFATHPSTASAAKSGTPQMTGFRPSIPASVPAAASGATDVNVDVSASVPSDSTPLDKNPDARANPAAATSGAAPATNTPAANTPAAGGATAQSGQNATTGSVPTPNKNGKPKKQKKVKAPKADNQKQEQQPAK